MKTIFVQIPSYRDPECPWTVKDLFAKAKYPRRVRVGICWQRDPGIEKDCTAETETEYAKQVRIAPFHWRESQGVCWARHQAQQLWDGEDYVLSIDSHMHFAPEWDERLISQLAECPSPKPVLSNRPAGYIPPATLQTDATPTILRAHMYTPQGDLRIHGVSLNHAPDKPLRGAFCAAGFIFATGDFISGVPYDPYFYFDQEEISLSARLFTHGFDIYSPKDILLYHYYRDTARPDTPPPPLHWEDNAGWMRLQERGRKRLNHLLGHSLNEHPEIIRDLDKYGMGGARQLEEYEAFCGIDFQNRIVSERALRCGFIENLERYLDKPIHIPEIDDVPKKDDKPPAIIKVEQFPPFDQSLAIERLISESPRGNKLNIDRRAPEGALIIYDFINQKTCKMLMKYADSQAFTNLQVVDPLKSTKDAIISMSHEGRITHHVDIDGMAGDILNIFNDIHCRTMAPFYDVDFEWYERPQILRYPPGGKYDQHADADHWIPESNSWVRAQDRDYSVLLYLNNDYEGGDLRLVNQDFTIKPRPGMLVAFPSDHRYLHAALPTTSGIRYVIVTWSAIIGSPRLRNQMPYASVFIRQKREAAHG